MEENYSSSGRVGSVELAWARGDLGEASDSFAERSGATTSSLERATMSMLAAGFELTGDGVNRERAGQGMLGIPWASSAGAPGT